LIGDTFEAFQSQEFAKLLNQPLRIGNDVVAEALNKRIVENNTQLVVEVENTRNNLRWYATDVAYYSCLPIGKNRTGFSYFLKDLPE